MNKSKTYEVIVSNWGCVYSGPTTDTANAYFEDYVNVSKTGKGRAGGESVTLMCDGEPVREYSPELEASRAIDKVETLTGLYDYLMGGVTESFEVDDIGADFAYLVGAVLKGGKCSWPEDRPFVQLLRAMPVSLTALRVKLLKHVEIEPEEAEDASTALTGVGSEVCQADPTEDDLNKASEAYHAHPSHPSTCERYREHFNRPCPCEGYRSK